MKVFLVACLISLPAVFGRMAFPVGTEREVETLFKRLNIRIRWDDSNFLVDEAGPYATCENARGRRGFLDVRMDPDYARAYGVNSVGGLLDTTRTTGVTVSGAKADILTMAQQWIEERPFSEQIRAATKFGCSVQPGCPGRRTVMVCLFTPRYGFQGEEGNKLVGGRPVAFTKVEYRSTENAIRRLNFQARWDKSHFLENLSNVVNKCGMIGTSQWNYEDAQELAGKRGKTIGLLYGWATKSGDTDRDVDHIIRGWLSTEEGQKQIARAKEIGCSLIQECPDNQTVVACLLSPGA